MAKIDDLIKQMRDLSVNELDELRKQIKTLIEEARFKEKSGQIEDLMKKARIGLTVKYHKGSGSDVGQIAVIKREGVQLDVEGKNRRILVKWLEIDEMAEE